MGLLYLDKNVTIVVLSLSIYLYKVYLEVCAEMGMISHSKFELPKLLSEVVVSVSNSLVVGCLLEFGIE
jgi:hypothetical protein